MEGKKGRMPRCLVRQCCLFFSCCVRPVKILGFSFTTNEVFLLTVSLHTDHLLFQDLSHTQSDSQKRWAFFLAPPVNGLRNLWSHWHCSRAKEKVTAEAKKANRVKCISWQEGTLSPSPYRNLSIAQMDAATSLTALFLTTSVVVNKLLINKTINRNDLDTFAYRFIV